MVIFRLKGRLALSIMLAISLFPVAATAGPTSTQTIVMVRHGEKPAAGLGQLDCQGLNRAIALPAVIDKAFGRPEAIFAPSPAEAKMDSGEAYDYVRPLATIEPTAIFFGLPVDASIGFSDIQRLAQSLVSRPYQNALVMVAWEHSEIVRLARLLISGAGGNGDVVPNWESSDFDSIYVVRIVRNGDHVTAVFERRQEGLDGQPTACPGALRGQPEGVDAAGGDASGSVRKQRRHRRALRQ